jgi:outer membrane protein TolC
VHKRPRQANRPRRGRWTLGLLALACADVAAAQAPETPPPSGSAPGRREITVRPAIPARAPFVDPALNRTSTPLPPPLPDPDIPAASPHTDPSTLSTAAVSEVGSLLVPGQSLAPIDLPSALKLAGARDLDIAIARQRIAVAVAELQQAQVLWLPSLFVGPTWTRLDGQVQTIQGPVITTSRSALFLTGTAAAGSAIPAAPPGSGYPPVNGLTTILRISDAIFEPLAARRVVASRQARFQAVTNDALLATAQAYFDLQVAAGKLAIAREAAANAERLVDITGSFARSGAGLEADHQRSLTERGRQARNVAAAAGELKVASTEIIFLLNLDPHLVVAPVEPAEMLFRIVPEDRPIDDLIVEGLHRRPELAEAQALVEATLARLKQARLRPFVPSLAFSYAGGGFGGGTNGFFGNFNSRGDAAVTMYWELQNLGLADRAIARRSAAQQRVTVLELVKVQNRVAADVVAAFEARAAASRELEAAGRALPEALRSLELNFQNIRRGAALPGATRPIEVLQPVQALAQIRADYLDAAIAYNRAQFRLYRALGYPPLLPPAGNPSVPAPPAPAPTPNPAGIKP